MFLDKSVLKKIYEYCLTENNQIEIVNQISTKIINDE